MYPLYGSLFFLFSGLSSPYILKSSVSFSLSLAQFTETGVFFHLPATTTTTKYEHKSPIESMKSHSSILLLLNSKARLPLADSSLLSLTNWCDIALGTGTGTGMMIESILKSLAALWYAPFQMPPSPFHFLFICPSRPISLLPPSKPSDSSSPLSSIFFPNLFISQFHPLRHLSISSLRLLSLCFVCSCNLFRV